jgi:hypothetical protein
MDDIRKKLYLVPPIFNQKKLNYGLRGKENVSLVKFLTLAHRGVVLGNGEHRRVTIRRGEIYSGIKRWAGKCPKK